MRKVFAQHYYVIQVGKDINPQQPFQYHLHCSLEGGRSVAEAKRHPVVLKQPIFGDKCGFWLVRVPHLDLPVP